MCRKAYTSQAGVVLQHVQHSSSVCVRSGVGAGLAGWLLRRAGGDDERLEVGCLAWQQRAPGLRAAQG